MAHITLRADRIDAELLQFLSVRYVVVAEQRGDDIIIELYKK